jgi:hypothetical protein
MFVIIKGNVVYTHFGNNITPIKTQLAAILSLIRRAFVTNSTYYIDQAVLCSEDAVCISKDISREL